MLNRDQIAHEYILSGVATTVHSAFQLADAMIAEAEKRKNVERPSVVGDGWISVEDRLPEHLEPVTAYSVDGGVFHAWTVDGSRWRNSLYYIDNVTHWQYLPSPPKGSK